MMACCPLDSNGIDGNAGSLEDVEILLDASAIAVDHKNALRRRSIRLGDIDFCRPKSTVRHWQLRDAQGFDPAFQSFTCQDTGDEMQFSLTERRMDFLPYLIVDDQRYAPYLTAAAAPQVLYRGEEDLGSQAAYFTDSC
jgi:hypothetical protein